MEPKFQSSFIPKGPLATTGTATRVSREGKHSILSTLALFVFVLSILLSLGVFGYERYLDSSIATMGGNLAQAKASLEPDVIKQISQLDERINATGTLLNNHVVLSPLFDYLENSTLKSVRFTDFQFQTTQDGLTLSMQGVATSYSAIALQSQIFNKSSYLKSPVFSDLNLDDKGNVTFSFEATLDPSFVSYSKYVNTVQVAPALPAVVATSTATSASSTNK